MHISELREDQRQALLDLAVLGMYLDGNLARVESGRVKILMAGMGLDTEYDRGREFDAAVTRIRPHAESSLKALEHAKNLSRVFTTTEERKFLNDTVTDLVTADGSVSESETSFLKSLREAIL